MGSGLVPGGWVARLPGMSPWCRTKAYVPAHCGCMFIARKPHSTGIKLYCLADATSGYVVDMYLYTGRTGTCGGSATVRATTMPSRS